MLIDARSSPLPMLDSTRLLAAAAFDVAVGHHPLPSWRGGVKKVQLEKGPTERGGRWAYRVHD